MPAQVTGALGRMLAAIREFTIAQRTLALLAVLDRPSAIAAPGGVQGEAPFQFVADNALKGVSDVPALTLHADAEWSSAHWDCTNEEIAQELNLSRNTVKTHVSNVLKKLGLGSRREISCRPTHPEGGRKITSFG